MTPEEWVILDEKFDKVYDKINGLREVVAGIQGVKIGENSVRKEVVQQNTLSLRKIGVVVTIIVLVIKAGEILVSRL